MRTRRRCTCGCGIASGKRSALCCQYLRPSGLYSKGGCPLILFLRNTKRHKGSGRARLGRNSKLFLGPMGERGFPTFMVFPRYPGGGFNPFVARPSGFGKDDFPRAFRVDPFVARIGGLLSSCVDGPRISGNEVCIVNLSVKKVNICSVMYQFPSLFTTTISVYKSIGMRQLPGTGGMYFQVFRKRGSVIIPMRYSERTCRMLGEYNTGIRCVRFCKYSRLS